MIVQLCILRTRRYFPFDSRGSEKERTQIHHLHHFVICILSRDVFFREDTLPSCQGSIFRKSIQLLCSENCCCGSLNVRATQSDWNWPTATISCRAWDVISLLRRNDRLREYYLQVCAFFMTGCQLSQVKFQVSLRLTWPVISLKPPANQTIEVSSWMCSTRAKTLTVIDNISGLRGWRCQSMCDDCKENSERDIVELHCCGIEPGKSPIWEPTSRFMQLLYNIQLWIPAVIHIYRHQSKIRSWVTHIQHGVTMSVDQKIRRGKGVDIERGSEELVTSILPLLDSHVWFSTFFNERKVHLSVRI